MTPITRAFISTLAIGSLVLVGSAQPARAGACTSGSAWYYGVWTNQNWNEYGARADNILVTGLEPCRQNRSIFIWDNSDDYVEVGWYRSGSNGDNYTRCTYSTAPRVFVFQVRNGAISCKPNTAILTGGEYYSFKVHNPDHDNDFHFFWGVGSIPGTALGPYTTDHTNGRAMVDTEAYQDGDNLRGHFTGVDSLGASIWHALPNPSLVNGPGNENPYVVCSWGSTFLHVEPSGSC
jgi:hypothetical protein